jgi:hypothetical protein
MSVCFLVVYQTILEMIKRDDDEDDDDDGDDDDEPNPSPQYAKISKVRPENHVKYCISLVNNTN